MPSWRLASIQKTLMSTLTLLDLSGKFKLCKPREVSYHQSQTALCTLAPALSLAEKNDFIASGGKQISWRRIDIGICRIHSQGGWWLKLSILLSLLEGSSGWPSTPRFSVLECPIKGVRMYKLLKSKLKMKTGTLCHLYVGEFLLFSC